MALLEALNSTGRVMTVKKTEAAKKMIPPRIRGLMVKIKPRIIKKGASLEPILATG